MLCLFSSISEFTFGDFFRLHSERDMDRLMQFKFNPFDMQHTTTGNRAGNNDWDNNMLVTLISHANTIFQKMSRETYQITNSFLF
jgi:hypothetical protein